MQLAIVPANNEALSQPLGQAELAHSFNRLNGLQVFLGSVTAPAEPLFLSQLQEPEAFETTGLLRAPIGTATIDIVRAHSDRHGITINTVIAPPFPRGPFRHIFSLSQRLDNSGETRYESLFHPASVCPDLEYRSALQHTGTPIDERRRRSMQSFVSRFLASIA